MCGIFGFISENDRPVDLKRLARIAIETETRGAHAFGFAWVDKWGRMRSFKHRGRISKHLDKLEMLREARIIIGHTRFATQGDPADNINNHPHPCDGGWLVHNGMIPTYREIDARFNLQRSSDCDSETIALLFEELQGPRMKRLADTVAELRARATAVLILNRDSMLIARAGNPARWGRTSAGIYLASLREGLPDGNESITDDVVVCLKLNKEGKSDVKSIRIDKLPEPEPTKPTSDGDGDDRDTPVSDGESASRASATCEGSGGSCLWSEADERADFRARAGRSRPRFERAGAGAASD